MRLPIFRFLSSMLFASFLFYFVSNARAQLDPPSGGGGDGRGGFLDSWSFSDTAWLSDLRYAPLTFTNLESVTNSGGRSAVLIDTDPGIPAFLVYNTVENTGATNLNCQIGTVSVWFSPDWSGTNAGGEGPGESSRLFEVGTYTTNASVGWLSLYLSPDGSMIFFSGQTNNGSQAAYLSAPVTLTNRSWNNVVLTYSQTNSAIYLNGQWITNGSGVTFYPGPEVRASGFSIGSSASDGASQIHGLVSSFSTYNYQWSSNVVYLTYDLYAAANYGHTANVNFSNAPSSPSTVPIFDAVTGAGVLHLVSSNSGGCITSSNVWLTNIMASPSTNQTINVIFSIAGGSNNIPYDLIATATLASPMTNAIWAWLGQGYHCCTYSLSIQSNTTAFFILGTPTDTDQDGLTDAYEMLVSRTDPNKADSGGDGMLDGWKILWGLNPHIDNSAQPGLRANYTFDPSPQLRQVYGIRGETFTFDAEGNIKQVSQ